MSYEEKEHKLKEILRCYAKEDVALAFSGGVDSSILLKMLCQAAEEYGSKIYGVTVHTRLHPSGDLEIAKRVCKEAGAIHEVLYVDELKEAGILENPVDRCYLCKKCIFRKIKEFADYKGISFILEGTNEDDLHVYRPGIKALKELSIISPLAMAGITKNEVRQLAMEYGVSVAKRPSTPCMATRFPYGDRIDYDKLTRVEKGEKWLLEKGFYNLRIRVHGNLVRLEVDKESFETVLALKDEIIEKMKELGYDYVTLDLEGFRSGSMDIHLGKHQS